MSERQQERQQERQRTKVKAGHENQAQYDGRGEASPFVGYDGERSRRVGEVFYVYHEEDGSVKLPSWCRIQAADGRWVNVPKGPLGKDRKGRPIAEPSAPPRRAHPDTLPGQAPKRRIHELETDEAELAGYGSARHGESEPVEKGGKKSGRAADQAVG